MRNKHIFNSLRWRIVLASILLVAVAVSGVAFYMQQKMEDLTRAEQYKIAPVLSQSVLVSV